MLTGPGESKFQSPRQEEKVYASASHDWERVTVMKHPVDAHVGKRIRHRRWMVGMTQQQLAEKVGIKFQQIQKYETDQATWIHK